MNNQFLLFYKAYGGTDNVGVDEVSVYKKHGS